MLIPVKSSVDFSCFFDAYGLYNIVETYPKKQKAMYPELVQTLLMYSVIIEKMLVPVLSSFKGRTMTRSVRSSCAYIIMAAFRADYVVQNIAYRLERVTPKKIRITRPRENTCSRSRRNS